MSKSVVFCTPVVERPTQYNLDALSNSLPLLEAAGWTHSYVNEIGNPYISAARSNMLRKALDTKPDVVVFIDYDVSWSPGDLLKLLETDGHVVAGTYRYKKDEEEYMGKVYVEDDGKPAVRPSDGAIRAAFIPAGFLKVTVQGLEMFAEAYPKLLYGSPLNPYLDLFNHGAHDGLWYGEDYAFCRNWRAMGQDIWLVPDLDITHHSVRLTDKGIEHSAYPGNFHEWLLKCPGGRNHTENGNATDLHAA